MPSRSRILLAFLLLGTVGLCAQEPPAVEETIPFQYVSAVGVLYKVVEKPIPEGAELPDKPIALTTGRTKLTGDPGANTLTISGPAAEVARLKAAATLLDVKPVQIIVSVAIGRWHIQGTGEPQDCIGSQLPRWEWDPAKVPVKEDRTLKASAWRIGMELPDLLQGLPIAFKVLAKPTAYTLARVPAKISTGQRGWTLQANGPEVGILEFEVVPTLQANGEIQLDLQFTLDPQAQLPFNDFPHLDTGPFQATITVPSRQSIYVGGIFLENSDGSRWELPVFISPRVVEDAADQ